MGAFLDIYELERSFSRPIEPVKARQNGTKESKERKVRGCGTSMVLMRIAYVRDGRDGDAGSQEARGAGLRCRAH